MKFLDVKTDYAFKKVFGSKENKDILISFLNAIIDFGDKKIEDLEIIDPYNIPMLKGMKDTYVDVKAKLSDKSKVIIEMQVLPHEGFEKRILYNAAKNYSQQLDAGDRYELLNPIIALTIVDFVMFEDTDKVITYFKLIEKEEFINYSDDIELIFIELPKFNKNITECKTIKDKWIYFIKNAGSLEFIPKNLDKEIRKALEIVNEANLTKEELEIQHKRKEFIMIQKSAIEKAKKEGLKEGLQEGLKEGLKEGKKEGLKEGEKKAKIEMAKGMLKDNMPIEMIEKYTSLTKEEIKSLKNG